MKKYDIVRVDLNPKKGHTQAGVRPCVIIQSNLFNKYASTLLVVPLTSVEKDVFPSEFWIEPSHMNHLEKRSRFLGSQIMTIDKKFVLNTLGHLDTKYHQEVGKAISVSLDLENDY